MSRVSEIVHVSMQIDRMFQTNIEDLQNWRTEQMGVINKANHYFIIIVAFKFMMIFFDYNFYTSYLVDYYYENK